MKKNLYILLIFFLLVPSATSQLRASDYKFHCVFIMNFIKYIEWPSAALKNDFVIGVMADNPSLVQELEKAASSRKASGLDITIKKVQNANDAAQCNVLYVPSAKNSQVEGILSSINSKSILLITEAPGMCKKGSIINFVMIEGKWKFELNKAAAEKAGLRVASELVKVSITV